MIKVKDMAIIQAIKECQVRGDCVGCALALDDTILLCKFPIGEILELETKFKVTIKQLIESENNK